MSNPNKSATDPSTSNKFGEGDRVKLKANPAEGFPEERGTVESDEVDNGTYCVRVDKKYRAEGDDGLREVTEDQMVRLVRKKPVDKVAQFLARIIREAKDILGDEFNFNLPWEAMRPKDVLKCKELTLAELLQHPVVRKELDGLAGWVLEGVQTLANSDEDLDELDSGPR